MNKHSIDLLQEACGATGQLLVQVERQGQAEVVEKKLFLPLVLIGRADNSDLPLVDPEVSRRHAYLQLIDGRLFGVDLRSRTGTHWEGGGKTGVGWVVPHQAIRIGPFCLRFAGLEPGRGSAPEDGWNPLRGPVVDPETYEPKVTLEWIKGPRKLFPWQMTSTLALIGRRAHQYGLVIEDPSVSSFQCSLLRSPLGTWVIDLLGQGGVALNGRRVRWGRLDDGDQLQLGRYTFRVRHGELAATTSRQTGGAEAMPAGETHRRNQAGAGSNGNHSSGLEPSEVAVEPGLATAVATSPGGPLVAVSPPYLTRTDLNEALLAPLFNQFAAMQNQMFDQFQQALMMMVEMFSEMQRDQVSLIRQEVDRLHQITEELQTLQDELAKNPAPMPGWVPPAFSEPAQVAEPEGAAPAPKADAATDQAGETPGAEPVQETAPKDAGAAPAAEASATGPSSPPAEVADLLTAAAAPAPTAAQPMLNIPQPPLAAVDGEVHMWLYEKIAALQRERQSRLQRIINFLRGK
jgi:pSer/pThr/pTyr-binding forkhead associated (FHA) protein